MMIVTETKETVAEALPRASEPESAIDLENAMRNLKLLRERMPGYDFEPLMSGNSDCLRFHETGAFRSAR